MWSPWACVSTTSETLQEVQPGGGHRRREFLLAGHVHTREHHVLGGGGLAGVDEPQDPVVFDRPAVDRERL